MSLGDDQSTSVAVYRGKVAIDTRVGTKVLETGQMAHFSPHQEKAFDRLEAPHGRLAELASFVGDPAPPVRAEQRLRAASSSPDSPTQPNKSVGAIVKLRKLLAEGKSEQARNEAESIQKLDLNGRKRSELLTIVAESYVAERQYQEAAQSYQKIWRRDTSATGANALIAAANLNLQRLNRPDVALNLFRRYLLDTTSTQ